MADMQMVIEIWEDGERLYWGEVWDHTLYELLLSGSAHVRNIVGEDLDL